MGRVLLSLSAAFILIGLYTAHASANEAREMFRSFVDTFSGEISEGIQNTINRSSQKKKRKKAIEATRVSGYCQVWRSYKLAVQKPCSSTNDCFDSDTCKMKFKWPTGGKTKIKFVNGEPATLNGKPTRFVSVGPDNCFTDGSIQNVFCFTFERQASDLIATYKEPTETNEQAYVQPEPEVALPEPKVIEAPSENENYDPSSEPTDFSEIVDQYIEASDNETDPVARKKRCSLGQKLLILHSEELDGETRATIREQIEADNCLG